MTLTSPMPSTLHTEHSPPFRALPYILLVVAVLLAYANVYDNAFLFDDELIITRNQLLQHWSTFGQLLTASTTTGAHIAGGFYRPVQLVLYFFAYQIAGLSTVAFHLVNVVVHAANACLMYKLGKKLRFSPRACFFAALIWAVHPVHTEAVTYMSGSADILGCFFCLSGCVLLTPDCSPLKVIVAIPLLVLALLSKEGSVIFPALVVLCLFVTSDNRFNPKMYLRTWPLWIIAVLYLFWRLGSDDFDGPRRYAHLYELDDFHSLKMFADHFSYRLFTFFATLPAYLGVLLWPQELHMERTFTIFQSPFSWHVLLGVLLFALAALQLFIGRGKTNIAFSWGLVWFAIVHFPETGLVVPINSLFLEHWMYIPTVGLFLGTAETIHRFLIDHQRRYVLPAMAALLIAISGCLIFRTLLQNTTWHDPIRFYTNMFQFGVVSARAHNNLALAYMDVGDIPDAIVEFQRALEITDTYAETRHNYALALLRLPDQASHVPEAIANLNRALEIDPNFYRSDEALAVIYDHAGDHEKAKLYYKRSADLKARFISQ